MSKTLAISSTAMREQKPHILSNRGRSLKTLSVLLGLGYGLGFSTSCHALPTGGQVISGSAQIGQSQSTLHVEQKSDRALVDWQAFGIQAGEKVQFQQPSNRSVTVNRVLGNDLSSINGQLTANGGVVLVNPHGIVFQEGAQVDVGSLAATTRWISQGDFEAGRLTFQAQAGTEEGAVINRGVITAAPGGSVVLSASQVENAGVIQAQVGRVALSAGDSYTLNFSGDPLLSFATPASSPVGRALKVTQSGHIQADGGTVLLTTGAAQSVVDSVVSMGGKIEARAVDFQEGTIMLHAGGGTASVSGTMDVSGQGEGQKGGTIQVLGNHVDLKPTAHLNASSHSGGGTILIGGDRHGENPAIQNAKQTLVEQGATIAADASQKGDGGRVIIWSDEKTRYNGQLSTRGGESSGNGGFVEISSKKTLAFDGLVDASAPQGNRGTLLLDPTNIEIVTALANAATTDVDQFLDPDVGGAGQSRIAPATLDGAAANVILQATNDITFTDAVSLSTAGVSLTAQAGRHITVNNTITTNNGAIHLEADSPHAGGGDPDGIGTLTIAAPGALNTGGSKVTLIGADFSILGTINAGAGNVDIGPSRTGINGNITIGSGILTLAELQQITSTGTLTIGKATTKGTDGAGTGATTPQSATLTVDTALLDFSGQNFALTLDPTTLINLGFGITLNNKNLNFTAPVTLTGSLTINSGGGNIVFGNTLDGGFNLNLNAGVGTVTLSGAVGATTPVGTGTGAAITVDNGSTGLVDFQNATTTASGITSGAATSLKFASTLTLGNGDTGTSMAGAVQLAGTTLSGYDGLTIGALTLSTGPVSLNSNGSAIAITTLAGGGQDLTLAAGIGAGTTTVSGAVSNLGDGTGAALTVNNGVTGLVNFQGAFMGNSGITSGTATSLKFASTLTLGNGDTGTSMAGAVELAGTTLSGYDGLTIGALTLSTGPVSLNSNGSAIAITTLAGGGQDLTLAAGIGVGTTTVSGAVSNLGDGTGAALTVNNGVTGLVNFQGAFTGNSGITSGAATSLKFASTLTLGNGDTGTSMAGAVELAGTTLSGYDGLTIGALTLSTGPVSLNSNGSAIAITTLAGGGQDLTLAAGIGVGTTTVSGTVSNLGDGTGAALTVNNGVTGLVNFQGAFTGNSGITSGAATSLKFASTLTLGNGDTGTSMAGAVELAGTTLSGYKGLTIGALTLSTGPVSLNSNGSAIAITTLAGGGQDLTLAAGIGAGTTTVSGAVSNLGDGTGAALTVNNGVTGLVNFQGAFTGNSGITSGAATSLKFANTLTLGNGDTGTSMAGAVELAGTTLSGYDGLTIGALTLSTGSVSLNSNDSAIAITTLAGGSQDLTLADGIGGGTTTVSGGVSNLGDGTGAALTVNNGATGRVDFQGAFAGNSGITSRAATSLKFASTLTLGNGDTGTSMAGAVELAGTTLSGYDGLTIGALTLSTGPVSLNSNSGPIAITNTLEGAQNLTVTAGSGSVSLPRVGGTTPLTRLKVDGGPVTLNGSVTTTGDVLFHADSGTGSEQKILLGNTFHCTGDNCPNDAPNILRILTNGGNIFFNKIIAHNGYTEGPDRDSLHVELLAGIPNAPVLPSDQLKQLQQKYTQTNGGTIHGGLDVWNVTLTGSGGALTGRIHKTRGELTYLDIEHKEAAETIYASPVPNMKFTLNGIQIPGYGVPSTKPAPFENFSRGLNIFIPDKISASDWVLDTSEHPVLYRAMADYDKKYIDLNTIQPDLRSENPIYDTFKTKIEQGKIDNIIIISVGKNKTDNKVFWGNLGERLEFGSRLTEQLFGNLSDYNVLHLTTNNTKNNTADPKFNNIISGLRAFADAKKNKKQRLIVYFVGHGLMSEGKGYWIAEDTGVNDKNKMEKIISIDIIEKILKTQDKNNQHDILLISESCTPGDLSLSGKQLLQDPEYSTDLEEKEGGMMSMTASLPFVSIRKKYDIKREIDIKEADNLNNFNDIEKYSTSFTPTPFSEYLTATLAQQGTETRGVDASRVHALTREKLNGWVELTPSQYIIYHKPHYGEMSKDRNEKQFLFKFHKDQEKLTISN